MSHDQIIASFIVLAYFAGAGTTFAAICTIANYLEICTGRRMALAAKPKMEMDADLEHIDQALALANS